MEQHAQMTSPRPGVRVDASLFSSPVKLKRIGTAAYRTGVLALLAVIAWPQLRPLVSNLPPAAALAQTGGGFRLGPSRNAPPPPPAAPAPSHLWSTYGITTYNDAFPNPGDMLPRNLGDVPVVYVVNLPYLDGGRRDKVMKDIQAELEKANTTLMNIQLKP